MEKAFSKYVACGNDFLLFDDREESFPWEDRNLISRLCHRQYGVGADGIILLQRSYKASMRMRIFNADGSEAEMCGNGIRCLLKFAVDVGLKAKAYEVETMDNIITISEENDDVTVSMGDNLKIDAFTIEWEGQQLKGLTVKAGVPHAVIFCDNIDNIDFSQLGPYVRHHERFAPHGINVNIAQRLPTGDISIRTFERGAGETLACGTGAVAVGLASTKQYGSTSPVNIRPKSSGLLTVKFRQSGAHFFDVTLTGPAYCSFKGKLNLETYR